MKRLLLAWISAITGVPFITHHAVRTRDSGEMAFAFRMKGGIAGDVNRTHPASIEPVLIDVDEPPTAYGQPVIVDTVTSGVRRFVAGDTAVDTAYGVMARPYPTQQSAGGMTSSFGGGTPPTTGAGDVLRAGYIMGKVPADSAAPKKGGAVFVWCAVSSGNHIQGNFETAANGGSTAALDPEKYQFNGGMDADGNVEISFNV